MNTFESTPDTVRVNFLDEPVEDATAEIEIDHGVVCDVVRVGPKGAKELREMVETDEWSEP